MNTSTRIFLCVLWAILAFLESVEKDFKKAKVYWFEDALFEFWVQKVTLFRLGNSGFCILPLRFWEEIGVWYRKDWHRFYLGLGFFCFFITVEPKSKRKI